MPKRSILPPPIHPAPLPILAEPDILTLPNGLRIYVLNNPAVAFLKVEAIVNAGRPHETVKSSARATSKLICEGSRNYTSQQLAELFDLHGALLQSPSHIDFSAFQVHTLSKHARALISAFADALIAPTFPQNELHIFKQNALAELAIDTSKPESLSYRVLTEMLYGANHPYGYNSTAETYRDLTTEHLHAFHRATFRPERTALILSGNITQEVLQVTQDVFSTWESHPTEPARLQSYPLPSSAPQKHRIKLKSSEQTAIKLGRRLFNRHHPDYIGMGLLNTILGGYFGSRLMSNIREKQGLTYHIYSSFDVMRSDGLIYIASEVNKRKTQKALAAIHDEMRTLQNELVSEKELQMVLNYLKGVLLMAVDGVINQSNLLKFLVVDGLTVDHFHAEIAELNQMTAQRIQALAQTYLNPDDFWEVIV